jgi:hypothetical protein
MYLIAIDDHSSAGSVIIDREHVNIHLHLVMNQINHSFLQDKYVDMGCSIPSRLHLQGINLYKSEFQEG